MVNHDETIEAALRGALALAGAGRALCGVAERAVALAIAERDGQAIEGEAPAVDGLEEAGAACSSSPATLPGMTAREALAQLAAHSRWNWRDAHGLPAEGAREDGTAFPGEVHDGWPLKTDAAVLAPADLKTARFLAHKIGQAIGVRAAVSMLASFLLAAWGES